MRRPLRNSEACEPDTDMTALLGMRAIVGVRRINELTEAGVSIVNNGEIESLAVLTLDCSAKTRKRRVAGDIRPSPFGPDASSGPHRISLSQNTMSNYCEPLIQALKDCLLHSDCVLKQNRLPSECLKLHIDELPDKCRQLRQATFECKRGMVRKIFNPW